MFSKIFFTILLISILNKICHAKSFSYCYKLSENIKSSSETENDLIVSINNTSSDDNFIEAKIPQQQGVWYLILSSCEDGAILKEIITQEEFSKRITGLTEMNKEKITINFQKLENNCIPIPNIIQLIAETIYPKKNDISTLYFDVSEDEIAEKKTRKSKSIKRIDKNTFVLLDDCTKNEGSIWNLTQVSDKIRALAKQVQDAAPIEFSGTPRCKKYVDIAKELHSFLKSKYEDTRDLKSVSVPTTPATLDPDSSTSLSYIDGEFCQVVSCDKIMRKPLKTGVQLQEVLDNIAKDVITAFKKAPPK